jgi:hypothetical protein
MTYTESAALMTDGDFRGRVKVACLKFATAIFDEAGSVTAHNSRMRWAAQCYQQPDQIAAQVQPPTVMDSAVQSAGAAIDDAALQSAVEAAINKTM